MITRDTVVVGFRPDLTEAEFIAIVVPRSKLTTLDAQLSYRAVVAERVSPAFCLAVFWHESQFGRLGICRDYNTRSPGNTRSSITLKGEKVETSQGTYIRYPSWEEGFRDLAVRLSVPNYIYGRKGLVTIAQIMPVFAPVADNNRPDLYIDAVINLMNAWIPPGGGGSTSNMAMEIIDLSGSTPSSVYTERGFPVSELILHDTSGGGDFNNKSEEQLQALLNATIHWFQGGGGLSIHYLIGPEKLGGKIYRLCKEQFAAFHAVGDKGLSTINGFTCSKDNRIAIGIERFGQPGDVVGPNQRAAFLWLVVDICKRNGLSASQVVSHASIQSDRTDGRVLLAAARDAVTSSIAGGGTTPVSPVYDPIMDYVNANGGEAVFGKPLGGQYGTNGSVERDFTFAHLYLDKTSGKVVAEVKDRTNPLSKKVGAGIYSKAKENNLMLITNEQWFSPDPGQPGLGKMSRAWAQDKDGVTVVLMASEQPELARPGQDTPWKVEVLEVK